MNFLAHIYLSGENDEIRIANFMADSIKGRKYLNYPENFQTGIILHRAIDYFTDTHPVFKKSTQRLFEKYGHYSGIIVDIFYDHFLASNWKNYSDEPLEAYTSSFYRILKENYEILPGNVKSFLPYMVSENWLLSYAQLEGIEKVLQGMNRRTGRTSNMNKAIAELKQYYPEFQKEFELFFDEAIVFSKKKINEIERK